MEFNATFLVSAISFILFTIIMNKIFYKPLESVMNEREKFINDNIYDAKLSSDKADVITKDREEKLNKSHVDAKSLVSRKINDANENSRNLTEQAKQKSKEDIKSAKEALTKEAEANEQNLRIEELADVIYSKVLEM